MAYDNYGGGDYTSYGAGGGADGGGFMAGSSQSPSHQKREYQKDTLRPVTIRQLLNAQQPHPDADFNIDNSEVSQLTFVGQVRNISKQTTNTTYKMDDGTGTIEVKIWNDNENDDETARNGVVQDGYARVWGKIKQFNNKRHIQGHIIRPIMDYNEISYHLLEATVVHLHFTRGPPERQQAQGGATGGNQYLQQGGNAYGAQDAGGKLPPGTSALDRKVFHELQTAPQTNDGLHVMDLARRLHMDPPVVADACGRLMEHGAVYTTIDEDTFAVLEM